MSLSRAQNINSIVILFYNKSSTTQLPLYLYFYSRKFTSIHFPNLKETTDEPPWIILDNIPQSF